MSEVYHVYSRWAALVFRLYNGSRTFQVEWTVGPVDVRSVLFAKIVYNLKLLLLWSYTALYSYAHSLIFIFSDLHGKEVIFHFETSLENNQTFWTDSNGRQMMKRVYEAS